MKFAIIAAGEGSRLAAEGVTAPKPLVEVCGEKLVDRLIRIFMHNGAEEICVVCNDRMPLVGRHLHDIAANGINGVQVPLRIRIKSTPSSMHSFAELSPLLTGQPFVLTTVDTIFREEEFADYIQKFRQALADGFDGMMGVTNYIDDEKPLYVATDTGLNITGFLDSDPQQQCAFISGGIYGLAPNALGTLHACMERGESRMRNFQRGLISDGRRLKAYTFSKVLDIDHASDIAKAEAFVN